MDFSGLEEGDEGVLTLDSLVLAGQDLEPYIIEWPPDGDGQEQLEFYVVAVMKRKDGVLLAVPLNSMRQEDLDLGNQGDLNTVVGLSTVVEVPTVVMDGGLLHPTGTSIQCLLVDFSVEVVSMMRTPSIFVDLAYNFDLEAPLSLPDPDGVDSGLTRWSPGVLHSRECRRASGGGQEGQRRRPFVPRSQKNTAGDKAKARARSAFKWREAARKARKTKESDNCFFGLFNGSDPSDLAHPVKSSARSGGKAEQDGEADGEWLFSCLPCIGSTSFSVGAEVECGAFGFGKAASEPSEDWHPEEPWYIAVPVEFSTGRVSCPGEGKAFITTPSRRRSPSPSCFGAVSSTDHFSGTDSPRELRSFDRFVRNLWHWYPRIEWQDEVASRTGISARSILFIRDEVDGKENESYWQHRRFTSTAYGSRSLRDEVYGALWRLWSPSGSRDDSVSGDDHHGFPSVRESPSGSGLGSAPSSLPRAGGDGQRQVRSGSHSMFAGRFASEHLPQPKRRDSLSGPKFLTSSRSKMDYHRSRVSQGDGHDRGKEVRAGRSKFQREGPQFQFKSKVHSKEERQRTRAEAAQSGRGLGGSLVSPRPNPLSSTISFETWCACLPRWILNSRTKFSWFLQRSFSAMRHDQKCMPTAVFPLPSPGVGCFTGGGLKLRKEAVDQNLQSTSSSYHRVQSELPLLGKVPYKRRAWEAGQWSAEKSFCQALLTFGCVWRDPRRISSCSWSIRT